MIPTLQKGTASLKDDSPGTDSTECSSKGQQDRNSDKEG